MPAGLANLGTDLSDDHPVSFPYTEELAAADPQLLSPSSLPPEVRLDTNGELQCTSCHDAHRDRYGKFLVRSAEYGGLCLVCHSMNGWTDGAHKSAGAAVPSSSPAGWPYTTVDRNACRSCHRPHSALGRERLLIFAAEEQNCLVCHDGQVAQKNILAELAKTSAHDPRRYQGLHDPTESLAGATPHVECMDCHNPHAAQAQPPSPTYTYIPLGNTLKNMPGFTLGGTPIAKATHEYQVCFRCHGDGAVNVANRIPRVVQVSNLRLKFVTANQSFHPVGGPSPSTDTVSLVPGLSHGALLRCTDCHNNDAGPRAGGTGPNGPHGSTYAYLLERRYVVADNTTESASTYALCYKCHRRTSILNDESFKLHKKHIVKERAPCTACHDPHGVPAGGSGDHTHLINFDTRIVFPEKKSGKIEFVDLGRFRGSCTLLCHRKNHHRQEYKR